MIQDEFRNAMAAAGLAIDVEIIGDGELHRCHIERDKPGSRNGWYVLHMDGVPAGSFGSWKTGETHTWCAKSQQSMTQEERGANQARIAEAKRARELALKAEQTQAAAEASKQWAAATPETGEHRYLRDKGVQAHGIRTNGAELLIPIRDIAGQLHGLQRIQPSGEKRFTDGSAIAGHYFSIGKAEGRIVICEGYATGASIHEATGYGVAIAFNCGNLEAVARAVKAKLPTTRIIIAADDDYQTDGNPGVTKATAAALAVGGLLAIPEFAGNRPPSATDFNDVASVYGKEAVAEKIARARPPESNGGAPIDAPYVELIRASDVTPEPVSWLWNGWLARGKVHILGGAPGTGKTTISMALAATVTTGGRWPDGSRSPVGNVVIWSGEDDPADTLVPRLILSGADKSRVYFVGNVREGLERLSFDPARHMAALRRQIAIVGDVKLLIVDPIVSAVQGDSHKNAEVRRGLQPLADLAASEDCALLGITHFSKGTGGREPVERITGSLAFGAVARVVLVAAKHQSEGDDGETKRLFLRAKSNIGPDDGGYEYDLHQDELTSYPGIFASAVGWGAAVEGSARELLANADATDDDGEGGKLDDAKHFLAGLLADGAVPVKAIKADAEGAGYSWPTIRRAQKALGVDARKTGMKGGWEWALPRRCSKDPEDAQQKVVSTFGNLDHLQGEPSPVEVVF